jgi:hypothetical protein
LHHAYATSRKQQAQVDDQGYKNDRFSISHSNNSLIRNPAELYFKSNPHQTDKKTPHQANGEVFLTALLKI